MVSYVTSFLKGYSRNPWRAYCAKPIWKRLLSSSRFGHQRHIRLLLLLTHAARFHETNSLCKHHKKECASSCKQFQLDCLRGSFSRASCNHSHRLCMVPSGDTLILHVIFKGSSHVPPLQTFRICICKVEAQCSQDKNGGLNEIILCNCH